MTWLSVSVRVCSISNKDSSYILDTIQRHFSPQKTGSVPGTSTL